MTVKPMTPTCSILFFVFLLLQSSFASAKERKATLVVLGNEIYPEEVTNMSQRIRQEVEDVSLGERAVIVQSSRGADDVLANNPARESIIVDQILYIQTDGRMDYIPAATVDLNGIMFDEVVAISELNLLYVNDTIKLQDNKKQNSDHFEKCENKWKQRILKPVKFQQHVLSYTRADLFMRQLYSKRMWALYMLVTVASAAGGAFTYDAYKEFGTVGAVLAGGLAAFVVGAATLLSLRAGDGKFWKDIPKKDQDKITEKELYLKDYLSVKRDEKQEKIIVTKQDASEMFERVDSLPVCFTAAVGHYFRVTGAGIFVK